MMTTFADFLRWEARSRDTIDFKKIYVDIAGDLNAGLMLSEIMYWYLPSKNSDQNKLRVTRDGYQWIAVHRYEWWERIRISPDQSDRALTLLVKKHLVTKTRYKFANEVCVHVRISEPEFLEAWNYALEHPAENPFILNANSDLGKKAKSKSGKKQNGNSDKSEILNTEGTTEPTAKNTKGTRVSSSSKKTVKPTESIAETTPPNPLVPALPLSPADAYIWAWAVISRYVRLELPAPYKAQFKNHQTAVNRKKARSLVESVIPITVETFANYVNSRTQNGAKEIKFIYLVDDCITFVLRNYQPPQPMDSPPPAEPIPELTPEQAAQRVMEFNRIMAELNDALVEKVVA